MTYAYQGEELELFREARNWKKYFSRRLKPFISGRVLEVGAGLGETTPFLQNEKVTHWTCLEPDPGLVQQLKQRIAKKKFPAPADVRTGTIASLSKDERFDTILYIDVLEHVEHDHQELADAASHLSDNGSLIVLSPAQQSVYNPFDKAIGHYRRYSKKTLREAASGLPLRETSLFYLEATGLLLLLVNKWIARERYPTRTQVLFWDRFIVPVSGFVDKLVFYSFGKTIVGIWRSQPKHTA